MYPVIHLIPPFKCAPWQSNNEPLWLLILVQSPIIRLSAMKSKCVAARITLAKVSPYHPSYLCDAEERCGVLCGRELCIHKRKLYPTDRPTAQRMTMNPIRGDKARRSRRDQIPHRTVSQLNGSSLRRFWHQFRKVLAETFQ